MTRRIRAVALLGAVLVSVLMALVGLRPATALPSHGASVGTSQVR